MIGLCALAAGGLAGSVVLVERATPNQVEHFAFTHLLEERRALDQDVARHALESRFQFSANYDQLATDDRTIRGLQADLATSLPGFLLSAERDQLRGALSRYAALQRVRQQMLERFKSRNALFKNSVSYFPALAGELLLLTDDAELLRRIADLRSQTLSLALRNDATTAQAQHDLIAKVAASAQAHTDELDPHSVQLMLAHARAIAENKVQTDRALADILALPIEHARQEVSAGYRRAYARAEQRADLFGRFVSVLALTLLGLLTYVGVRLRAAARALRGSHARLEQTVLARTAELRNEMSRRELMEIELRQGQKLEAVGQLAAGIAHEINTPIQYVGDSLYFLREAFGDVLRVLDGCQAALAQPSVVDRYQLTLEARRLEADVDLPSLKAEIPQAFDRATDGVRQVAHVVQAMKTFSHASPDKAPLDVNAAIDNTLTIARNEYKFVADLVTQLGEIPEVTCNAAGIRQVLLNLLINAAHAITDVVGPSSKRGQIRIQTELREDSVVIAVSDTGTGIPEAVRDRVFDPFFTTKQPGKGSGQGLAISRRIVEQHGGKLWFSTELDRGTTFFVQLPIGASERRGGPTSIRSAAAKDPVYAH